MAKGYNLNDFTEVLEDFNFQYKIIEAAEGGPSVRQLLINLGEDKKPLILELLMIPGASKPEIMQLFVLIGSQVDEQYFNDLSRIITRINNELPFGRFGMIEDKNIFFFRHLLPFFEDELSEKLLYYLIKSLRGTLDVFTPLLEAVARGEKTYEASLPALKEELLRIHNSSLGSD